MREKCDEAGLKDIPLLVGGNIVIGKQKFEDVEKRFKDMGFDYAFPPGTAPETTIDALHQIFKDKETDTGVQPEGNQESSAKCIEENHS